MGFPIAHRALFFGEICISLLASCFPSCGPDPEKYGPPATPLAVNGPDSPLSYPDFGLV